MLAGLDVMLIGAGLVLAAGGAVVLDLWLLVASCRSLLRRDGLWGLFGIFLSLVILGAAALYVGLLAQVVLVLGGDAAGTLRPG